MEKYEGVALKLRDYELKKYSQWKAETESRLALLMKRPLLAVITSEGRTHHDLVCITHCFKCLPVLHNAVYTASVLTLLKPLPL